MKQKRNGAFRVLAAAELVFAVVLTLLFVKEAGQKTEEVAGTWDSQSFLCEEGVLMTQFPYSDLPGLYVDNSLFSEGQDEITVRTPKIALQSGWYRVQVTYSLSDAGNFFGCTGGGIQTADFTRIPLHAGVNRTAECTLHLLTGREIGTEIRYEGDGYLYLNSVTVTRVPGVPTDLLACGILGFLALHLLLLLRSRLDRGGRRYLAVLAAAAVFTSIPLFLPHLCAGDDLDFHLLRTEALAAGLSSGQFPVRVSTLWNNGWGYGSSLYYCDLFLLFPALLRLAGVCAQRTYALYGWGINLLTVGISWHSFRRMFPGRKTALAGTLLYTLLPYRLLCLYRRAAVGEYTAMAFFPLLAAGIYRIYTAAPPRKDRPLRERMAAELSVLLPAVLGLAGILFSHVISSFFAGAFLLLICLLCIRRTLRRPVLIRLIAVLALTLCLGAWFAVPFADSMRNPIQVTSREGAEKMGAYGAHFRQLLNPFPDVSGGNVAVSEEADARNAGLRDITYSAGVPLYGSIAFVFVGSFRRRGKGCLLGKLCAGLGFLSAFMSSLWFPWQAIASQGALAAALVSDIQFPWRLLGPAGLFSTIASMCLLEALQGETDAHARLAVWWGMVLLSAVSGICVMSSSQRRGQGWNYTAEPPVETTNLGGGEYLPEGADPSLFSSSDPVPGAGVAITDFREQDGILELTLTNGSGADSCVDLPLLYYPGYAGRDAATGENFATGRGEAARVRLYLPKDYAGTIRIRYQERKLWRLSELVTAVTLLLLLWTSTGNRRKREVFVR